MMKEGHYSDKETSSNADASLVHKFRISKQKTSVTISRRLLKLKRNLIKHPHSVPMLVKYYKYLCLCPKLRCHHHFNLSAIYKRKLKRSLRPHHSDRMQDWTPPINATTLNELSINYIFKSIQLRHDLVFDKHLRFRSNMDREKTERYWKRVDAAFSTTLTFDFLRPIIQELCRILVSLMRPHHHVSLPWFWPASITRRDVYDMLDADLIVQQLKYNRNIGDQRVLWLKYIFDSLLQGHRARYVDAMCRYFTEEKYMKALKQCFSILEMIKLSCANRVLGYYRNYLIDTCAEYEYRCFDKHHPNLASLFEWFSATLKRIQGTKNIFYAGLVYLIADDDKTSGALDLPVISWPITLKFDKRRLTQQFRYEFYTIVDMSILMIPYRQLLGNQLISVDDIQSLKHVYLKGTDQYRTLSLFICRKTRRNEISFWENWLFHNLQATSRIYKIMYDRVCHHLQFFAQYGQVMETTTQEVANLSQEIQALGKKIKKIADLNLETYGNVYKNIINEIIKK